MKLISLREEAIHYRRQGYSYNMIKERLGLSKSTLSNWLKEIPFTPNVEVMQRIGIGKVKSAQFKNKQKIDDIKAMRELAQKELGRLTKRDIWFLGIGLYLGEGSKLNETIRFINSDPKIIQAALKWFKEICGLGDKNIVPTVHLYPDVNSDAALTYWSKIIHIPRKQFAKTQVDRRLNKSGKKKRKLPYGTLHIQIKSCGEKRFGKSLHRRIMGWIESATNQI